MFSIVQINEGNGYNNTSGYFTAPVQGLYEFTASLCTEPDNYMTLQIKVRRNSEEIVISSTQYNEKVAFTCTSTQGIARLLEGDLVYVYLHQQSERLHQDDYLRCQFTGTRIAA